MGNSMTRELYSASMEAATSGHPLGSKLSQIMEQAAENILKLEAENRVMKPMFEIWDRAFDLVKRIAEGGSDCNEANEAAEILKLLPRNVDQDTVEARKIAGLYAPGQRMLFEHGEMDHTEIFKIALTALCRGRALERFGG